LVTAFLTFSEYQSMARSIALEQGRNVSKELITTFNHMSDIVRDEPETNYALVPQVVVTQIAQKISTGGDYSIRQVALNYRNPDNRPDQYESEQLKNYPTGQSVELHSVTTLAGEKVFRYMKSLVADDSCLKCHGSYDAAPGFIQQRFPRTHPSYNYRSGEVIGAVSFIKPMRVLYGEAAGRLSQELVYRAGMLVVVAFVIWLVVRRLILSRIQTASATIRQITSTGSLSARIPVTGAQDEIGQLLRDFNAMMTELDRTTLQREESEDRYRSLIEAAQSAIVTFLGNGKIVISNLQAEQLIGLSREKLLGESLFDFLEDGSGLQQKVENFKRQKKHQPSLAAGRYRIQNGRGEVSFVDITLVFASETESQPMFTAILRNSRLRGHADGLIE
ncbi:MAG: DUF3365 domain-containing protein, partial [Pelovirga sp.]